MRFIQHYGQFLCVYQFYPNHFLSLTVFFVSLTTLYTVPNVSQCQLLSIQSNDYNYYNNCFIIMTRSVVPMIAFHGV